MAVTPLAKYKLVFLVRCCASQELQKLQLPWTTQRCPAACVDCLLHRPSPLLQGDQSVGKTSIITRFMYDKFDTTYQAGAPRTR